MTTQAKTTTDTAKGGAKKITMDDGIRRPRGERGAWGFRIDLKQQPAQRCANAECPYRTEHPKSQGFRHWTNGLKLDACPYCGEQLRETNERRLVDKGGFQTKLEAVTARDVERAKYHRGAAQAPLRMTVAQYLGEVWLPSLATADIEETTRDSYDDHVRRHLIGPPTKPFPLGTTQLRELTTTAVKEHYEYLAESYDDWAPKRDPETRRKVLGDDGEPIMAIRELPGLGAASIRRIHAVLHRALNIAIERRLLETNPAMGAARKLPKKAKAKATHPLQFWNPNELQRFLDFVDHMGGERGELYPLWFLMGHTGIRRGEAAGLRWEDFDVEAGTLHIRRSRVPLKSGTVVEKGTKTKGSKRDLDLDPDTVEILDKRQRKAQTRAHLLAGPKWGETGYIFTDVLGAPLHPNAITWQFRFARERANRDAADPATPKAIELSPLSVHGLRHTFATIALQAGMPVTVVSKYLGHSSVTMTLNVYSHCLRGAQQELANTVADVIRKGAF
jgi:integrase